VTKLKSLRAYSRAPSVALYVEVTPEAKALAESLVPRYGSLRRVVEEAIALLAKEGARPTTD
jgi:hypothetical protein